MGMGLVSFAPILVTAILTQVITIKRFFKLDNSKPAEPVQPKIQVQSREVKQSGDEKAQELVQESTETEQVENNAAIEPEHVVEAEFDSEPEVSESLSEDFFDLNSNSDTATAVKAAIETKIENSLKTDAEFEYERILALMHDEKCRLLLAGANTFELGVNYPINIGIRLGQAGKKCILLDADNSRNAIAKAFDLDPESVGGRAVKSGIEGLWVSSVKTEAPAISLAKLVKNATKLFDCVVIYAPNLSKESEIGNIADKAVVFGSPAEPGISAMVQAFKSSCQNVLVFEEMVKPATEVA
jgi:hypothetical protein